MPIYPKRLIEVDLPIRRISAHARREKSIRHGHISTLHIWWARRPLAACRAVICAALWPDPADENCPHHFWDVAYGQMHEWTSHERQQLLSAESRNRFESARKNPALFEDKVELRGALLDFIADFANWDNSTQTDFLATSRALTKAAHEALGGEPGTRPLVVDPFAGGGSIPLEALRVGADAFASDLNPVPVLLNKVVLEYIPKYGQRLADEVRKWGERIKQEAEKELAEFYPPDLICPDEMKGKGCRLLSIEDSSVGTVFFADMEKDISTITAKATGRYYYQPHRGPVSGRGLLSAAADADLGINPNDPALEQNLSEKGFKPVPRATPIAYLWARTIQCEGPGCGAEVPMIKSLWLGKKPHNSWSLRLVPNKKHKRIEFEVVRGAKPNEVGEGTVRRGSATCLCCGYTTPSANVRKQLLPRHGGSADARLFCVVTTRAKDKGRFYRGATPKDLEIVGKAKAKLQSLKKSPNNNDLTPTEPTPIGGGKGAGRAFSQRNFGMDAFEDLFTPRQLLTLITLVNKLKSASKEIEKHHPDGVAQAVRVALAFNIDKMADYGSSLASWSSPASQETVRGTFSRQALSITWDFAEAYPFASSSGGWLHNLNYLTSPLEAEARSSLAPGHIERASATSHPMPDDCVDAFVTDPPYYDAIPYADLSDFFIVWLKRSLEGSELAKDFSNLSPKDEECVVDEVKGHDAAFFERTMAEALTEGRRLTKPAGVGIVVFAHKSTAGWEAQLQAMINAGWVITGSWPIDTEREGRTRANSSAALASSVHLVCRPRENPDGSVRQDEVGDWRDVLAELPRRIHDWMPRLAEEGVVGADAIFACLGPALEIFSRYSRVEKASGEVVALKEYLEQVWAAVAKEALSLVFKDADTASFEPDARLTAMWLWTLKADTGADARAGEDEEESDDADGKKGGKTKGGFGLEYDAARKIAQGLGAHLEDLTSLVEVAGENARLLPVAERAKYLFGKDDATLAGKNAPRKKTDSQLDMFKALVGEDTSETTFGETKVSRVGETALDRVHQTMILFAAGRSEAMKRFLVDDGIGKDARFWSLARALSALYPANTEEKRWVDGVLARKKGLGF